MVEPEPEPEPSPPPPPAPPLREGVLSISFGDDPATSILLQWDISPEEMTVEHAVTIRGPGGQSGRIAHWERSSDGGARKEVIGLKPGTDYLVDWSVGGQAKGSVIHATLLAPTTTTVPPPEPVLTVALGSIPQTGIRVCWANATPREAAGFGTFWRPLGPDGFLRIDGGWSADGSGGSCSEVRGLTPGTGYQVLGRPAPAAPEVSLTITTAAAEDPA